MRKFIIFTICVALSGALRAQTTGEELRQSDDAIKTLATELAKKLAEERAATVAIGRFTFMDGTGPLSSYLHNQLSGELADVRGRSFTLISGGNAECVVSGDAVRIGNIIRVYSRLVRRDDNALVSQIRTDMEINPAIASMLSSDNSGGPNSFVMADEWEPDSWEAPVTYSMGADAAPVHRTIHADDHDWFLVEPDSASSLVIETTGHLDTYMTLYDADSGEELTSNDDGNDGNARIRHFVRPGNRYIVEVRGYSPENRGEYGLKIQPENMGEPTPYQLGSPSNAVTATQRLGSGHDIFLLTPDKNGMMVMETSGEIDLFLELFDAETYELLADDDDGGSDSNARIMFEVQRGRQYLARVKGFSDFVTAGGYGFKAWLYGE